MIAGCRIAERSIAASLAQALVRFAEGKGADRRALLAATGLAEADLADPDARLGFGRYVVLVREAARLTRDPSFALHFGAEVEMEEFSVVGLIGQASRTMPEALAQLNRYGGLVIETDVGPGPRFSNEFESDGIWMVDHNPGWAEFPELTEITFARMLCGVRRFAPQLGAHQIEMRHPAPAHASEIERVLGAPVQFGAGRNAYRIDENWLSLELNLQPRYVFAALTRHADALLAELEAASTLRARVERLMLPILHTGEVGVDRIAGDLAMSRQTLYRHLKAEGITFEAVLDALRHRLGIDYLSTQRVSVNQTAYLLGFSDPAAFSRAFKRWEGVSPKEVRLRARERRLPDALECVLHHATDRT